VYRCKAFLPVGSQALHFVAAIQDRDRRARHVLLAGVLLLRGLTAVVAGKARVVQLFGRYRGTIREPGLQWVNPFTARIVVSTRIRNQESAQLKVNDADGNPIEASPIPTAVCGKCSTWIPPRCPRTRRTVPAGCRLPAAARDPGRRRVLVDGRPRQRLPARLRSQAACPSAVGRTLVSRSQ